MAENSTPVDLNSLAKSAGPVDVTVSPQETTEDADHRRWKDKILFVAAIACLGILFLACLGVLALGTQSAEEKKIWAGILASLITGLLGYALGKIDLGALMATLHFDKQAYLQSQTAIRRGGTRETRPIPFQKRSLTAYAKYLLSICVTRDRQFRFEDLTKSEALIMPGQIVKPKRWPLFLHLA